MPSSASAAESPALAHRDGALSTAHTATSATSASRSPGTTVSGAHTTSGPPSARPDAPSRMTSLTLSSSLSAVAQIRAWSACWPAVRSIPSRPPATRTGTDASGTSRLRPLSASSGSPAVTDRTSWISAAVLAGAPMIDLRRQSCLAAAGRQAEEDPWSGHLLQRRQRGQGQERVAQVRIRHCRSEPQPARGAGGHGEQDPHVPPPERRPGPTSALRRSAAPASSTTSGTLGFLR